MRELKFRAWDGEWMYEPIIWGDTVYRGELSLEGRISCDDPVMQYTGLKDKNGKEIYEGDIVDFVIHTWDGGGEQYVGEVVFSNGMYHIETTNNISEGSNILFFVLDQDDGFEVIGNVYENSELLVKTT